MLIFNIRLYIQIFYLGFLYQYSYGTLVFFFYAIFVGFCYHYYVRFLAFLLYYVLEESKLHWSYLVTKSLIELPCEYVPTWCFSGQVICQLPLFISLGTLAFLSILFFSVVNFWSFIFS